MKRLLLIFGILVLALGAFVLPAAAQDEDYTTLAQYFPVDAPLYAGFRIDDAFVQTLDELMAKVEAAVPGSFGSMSGSLVDMLDEAASSIKPNGTFANTIRTWLGDTGAIGVYTLADTGDRTPLTIALTITDQDEAEAFFASLPNADRYTVTNDTTGSGEDYTLYSPLSTSNGNPYIIFHSDVVLLTMDSSLATSGGVRDGSLVHSDAFNTALEMLPESQYNGVIYVDTPAVLTKSIPASANAGQMQTMSMFDSMLDALQPQAFGFTILNDHALTIDIASPINAGAGSSAIFDMAALSQPVDPTFAQLIPAGTPLLIHSTDLYGGYQRLLDNLNTLAQTLPSSAGLSPDDVNSMMFGLNFVIRGLTGLESDAALGWMTGDYALYLKFSPEFTDSPNFDDVPDSLPIDFALAFAATDAESVQAVYDGLSDSLSNFASDNATITEETLASGDDALVLTASSSDLPFPLELLIAKNEDVFIVGTRRMVNAALDPQNSLDSDAAFTAAGATLLENPSAVFYLSGSGLQPLARAMINSSSSSDNRDGAQLKAVLGLIQSATISTSVLPDASGTLVRFVWTLPE